VYDLRGRTLQQTSSLSFIGLIQSTALIGCNLNPTPKVDTLELDSRMFECHCVWHKVHFGPVSLSACARKFSHNINVCYNTQHAVASSTIVTWLGQSSTREVVAVLLLSHCECPWSANVYQQCTAPWTWWSHVINLVQCSLIALLSAWLLRHDILDWKVKSVVF